jgi:undecaprenyl-diphosphatase
LLGNIYLVAVTLFLGGIVLVVFELFHKEKIEKTERLEDVSYKHAFFIGLAQAAAIIPGISRSAATIIGAISLKHQRKTAVEFSFLLAVPTMVAAVGLDVVKSYKNFSLDHLGLLLVGFVVSFITALIAVKFLLKFIQRNTFLVFGVYRILIAAVLFFVIY